MIKTTNLPPNVRPLVNWSVMAASIVLCCWLSLARLPGMELLGLGPNWLLIWVVSWSVKRSIWQGAMAGLVLGLVQDGMTSVAPSSILSLVIVGVMTSRIQKQKYIQEDFISIALIVFAMALVGETITAVQYIVSGIGDIGEIWLDHQRFVLASAILSSLWAPVVYYPLSVWWYKIDDLEQK